MAKFGSTLMSLFLDKKARENLKNKPLHSAKQKMAPASTPVQSPPQHPHLSPEEICNRLVEAEQEMAKNRSPERLQLIKNAMKIRTEQAKMLDQLSDEQRQMLQDFAVKSFLNGGAD